MSKTTFVLVHSPLVGPLTWEPVSHELRRRGLRAVIPVLHDDGGGPLPFWQQHAGAVAAQLKEIPEEDQVVWVAHSGAGGILPALRHSSGHTAAKYVFVDAGIPRDGATRLEMMRLQDPQWADEFLHNLQNGECFPNWSEKDLQAVIPDGELRRKMVAEVRPRDLAFFNEPIPVFAGWPDAPCAYLKFSAAYQWDYDQAKKAGWLVNEVEGGHFHMLVDPEGVTKAILAAVNQK